MMDDTDIVRVLATDWIGLYHKGKLIAEGPEISVRHALESLGYKVHTRVADKYWVRNLPQKLEEL